MTEFRMLRLFCLTASTIFLIQYETYAQGLEKFVELFTFHPNAKRAAADSSIYPSKLILSPIFAYSPETDLGFGVGAKYLFKFKGSGDETRTSNMPLSLMYTLQNQFILFSGFEVFSNQEKWMLEGNIILQNFPRLYYGIGADTPEANEEEYTYNQILLEPILLKNVFVKYFYLGAGVRYNRVGGVDFEEEGLLEETRISGYNGSTAVGLELAAVYDSRNNLLNAKNGWYMEITHGFYDESFGSTHNFQLSRLDLRHFFQPFKEREDVLAFQLKVHMSHNDAPLNDLAAFGSEEIMRGYYEGRFVDRHMWAFQGEYRRKISGRLGGVLFAGIGDVENRISNLNFSGLKSSVGFGLRFLLDKRENLNLRFDWGFGERTNNYYFNIAEAF